MRNHFLRNFCIGTLLIVAGATGASASTINYASGGTLTYSGFDPLFLAGTEFSLAGSLSSTATPIAAVTLSGGGIQDTYSTTMTDGTYGSGPATIAFNYFASNPVNDSIVINGSLLSYGITYNYVETIFTALTSAGPSALANVSMASSDSFNVGVLGMWSDYGISAGSFTANATPVSATPEPGAVLLTMSGLAAAAAYMVWNRRNASLVRSQLVRN